MLRPATSPTLTTLTTSSKPISSFPISPVSFPTLTLTPSHTLAPSPVTQSPSLPKPTLPLPSISCTEAPVPKPTTPNPFSVTSKSQSIASQPKPPKPKSTHPTPATSITSSHFSLTLTTLAIAPNRAIGSTPAISIPSECTPTISLTTTAYPPQPSPYPPGPLPPSPRPSPPSPSPPTPSLPSAPHSPPQPPPPYPPAPSTPPPPSLPPPPSPSPPAIPPPSVKLTLPTLTNAPFFVALALPGGIASYCQLCGCAMDYTDPNGNTGSSVNNEHISSYSGGSVASRRSMVASGNTTNLGVVSSLVVDSNTSKIDAAWLVRPDGAGVYSLELTLGTAHMLVQVKVDLTPPTVVGVITEGAQSSSASDPTSTGVSQGSSSQRLLLVTLNFSKPVTVAAGAVTSNTSTILQLISSNSGMVLQVMALGSTGQIASFRMARASYMDAAGNTGATDLDVSLASSKTALSPAATAQVASTASAASAGVAAVIGSSTVVAATAAAGSSFGKAMVSKGSSLQSSFHLQMLAMSSQLASPGIGDSYRMIAKYFRWTMLGVRGSVPVLDGLFSNSAKNVSAVTAAQNSDPGFWPSVTVASPPPPSTSSNTTSSSRRRASSSSGSSGNSSSAILQGSGLVLVVTTQELLYTLAIAGLLMVALTLLRSALAFLYLRYVDPSLLAQFLEFPRLEAMAAGALIMALTFNASVALVGPESDVSDAPVSSFS
ncbi:MAG: hypothetical protein WDW36_005113 [Sanguina aurantia]